MLKVVFEQLGQFCPLKLTQGQDGEDRSLATAAHRKRLEVLAGLFIAEQGGGFKGLKTNGLVAILERVLQDLDGAGIAQSTEYESRVTANTRCRPIQEHARQLAGVMSIAEPMCRKDRRDAHAR